MEWLCSFPLVWVKSFSSICFAYTASCRMTILIIFYKSMWKSKSSLNWTKVAKFPLSVLNLDDLDLPVDPVCIVDLHDGEQGFHPGGADQAARGHGAGTGR